MAYKIVLVDEEDSSSSDSASERAVGERVLLANLPSKAEVFAFYYPGSSDTSDVESRLRSPGERSGYTLYVNMGSLVDRNYRRVAECFGIGRLPVIIVTAVSPLAAPSD